MMILILIIKKSFFTNPIKVIKKIKTENNGNSDSNLKLVISIVVSIIIIIIMAHEDNRVKRGSFNLLMT